MKLLIIYPYFLHPQQASEDAAVMPIGVYSLAAVAREHGHDVKVVNWSAMAGQTENMAAAIAGWRPDVVGLSIVHANRWGGIDIARLVRQTLPAAKIVFGGVGATMLWEHLLAHVAEIDAVVLGEGEAAIVALLDRFSGSSPGTLTDIAGLAIRGENGPERTAPRPVVADLDRLPDPSRYFDYQHLVFARGCPHDCHFCGSPRLWGRRVRYHGTAYFVDQIQRLVDRGIRFFYVSDDTFTQSKRRVLAVCQELVRRRLAISWAAISRVDAVDEEILGWMRRAGCIQISYGVESGSPDIRRALGKHFSEDRIVSAFALTQRFGILPRAYLIYGCPGETADTIEAGCRLMDRCKPLGAVFYILDLFPGTRLYDDYLNREGLSDDIWLERIEDRMYHETDPALSPEAVMAFGRRLRTHFHTRLPEYAAAVDLDPSPQWAPFHADFLSRLGMTFLSGEYSRRAEIPEPADVAEGLFHRALDFGTDARAFLGLGMTHQRRGDLGGSIRVLSEGVERYPDDGHMAICLAVSHIHDGRPERAERLLAPHAHLAEAAPYLAHCYRALGRMAEADAIEARLAGRG